MRPGILICFLLVTFFVPAQRSAAEDSYSIGVVPQQSPVRLMQLWAPVLDTIYRQTGIKLRFKTATGIPAFEDRIYTGEYDFVYMNPYHYVNFSKATGYQAIAKEKDKQIQGILVVHKESGINDIKDLQGSRIAFPSKGAFAASMLPRSALHELNIDIDASYVGSHDSVYHLVARKLYPAGGGIIRTLESTNPQVFKQLKILWSSKKYSPHALAVHKRVPGTVIRAVQDALIKLGNNKDGKNHLDKLNINGFTRAKDSDWDDIRSLDIDALY